jgi:hypothetical protein
VLLWGLVLLLLLLLLLLLRLGPIRSLMVPMTLCAASQRVISHLRR